MRKTMGLIIGLILSMSLMGCGSAEKKKDLTEPKTGNAVSEKVDGIMFKNKEIQVIELNRLSKNDTFETTNKDTIKSVVLAIENSLPTKILLDQEAKEAMDSHITFDFKDGTKKTYFVWIEDDSEIMLSEDKEAAHVQGYEIDGTKFTQALKFFNK